MTLSSTPFDWPILLLVGCILASELSNPGRVQAYGSFVMKTLTFFFSFVLVYYLTATTIRSRESVLLVLRLLTGGATVVAALGILELRTGFNVFNKLHSVLPFLILDPTGISDIERGGHLRIYGPAQHPIALGGLLALIVPVAVYLTKIGGRRWFFATILLILGALATGSRTALTMSGCRVHRLLRSTSRPSGPSSAGVAPRHRRHPCVLAGRDRQLQGGILSRRAA